MRVCLVTGEYPPMQGGVGDYTRELSRALQQLGHSVLVLTSTQAQTAQVTPPSDDPQVQPIVGRWNWGCWANVLSTMRDYEPDILHIQYQTAAYAMHPAVNLLPMRVRQVQSRPQMLVTFHDLKVPYLFPKAGCLRQWANTVLARGCDGVIATNEEDYQQLARPAAPSQLRLIPIGSNIRPQAPDGYDRLAYRRGMGITDDETVLCYFGFLNSSKGGEALLRTLAELVHRGHRIRLMMIGGQTGASDPTNAAYLHHIQELSSELSVGDRVIWTGFTASEQVSANFWAADICVLPYRDGASYRRGSFLAALAHGMPIVSTQPRAAIAALEDGKNILLTPPDDVHALAEAVERLITTPALRLRIGQAALALAEEFRWDRIAGQTAQFYHDLLET